LLLLAIGLVARAGVTYSANLEIIGNKPDDFEVVDPRLFSGSLFWARGQGDLDVVADWPYLRCAIRDERVVVTFLATAEDWPERFPDRATCRSGEFKLVLTLKPRAHEWGLPPAEPQPVTEVALSLPPERGRAVSGAGSFRLPPGAYAGATVQAVDRAGQPWEGVFCRVNPDRREPWLLVLVADVAPAGVGSCELPRQRGEVLRMPVLIAR
jgi:hypothetical protein